MPKVAPFFDIFFKGESYARQAELIRECGFDCAETWRGIEADKLKEMTASGLKLVSVLVNTVPDAALFPSMLASRDAFLERVDRVADNALAVGCKQAIVTSGNHVVHYSYQTQRAILVETLAKAGEMLKSRGFSLNLEPLNTEVDHAGYLVDDPNDAVAICKETGCSNIRILFDVYHMGIMRGNLTEFIRNNINSIGHFHIAGIPGRHEVARGETNYPFLMEEIDRLGYDGYIGLEYIPKLPGRESLEETKRYLNL